MAPNSVCQYVLMNAIHSVKFDDFALDKMKLAVSLYFFSMLFSLLFYKQRLMAILKEIFLFFFFDIFSI